MIVPFILPLLLPLYPVGIVFILTFVEPVKKWERIVAFIPYLNLLYLLMVGVNKAVRYVREGE